MFVIRTLLKRTHVSLELEVLPKGKEGLLPYSLINDADKLTMVYSQLKIAQNL